MICAPKVLRRLLMDIVETQRQTLDSFLLERKQSILKKYFGKANSHILFPPNNQPTNIERWDIGLLLHILLTSCISVLPASAVSKLSELRTVRNEVAHFEGAAISEREFDYLWFTIGEIVDELVSLINDSKLTAEIEEDVRNIENRRFFKYVAENQNDIIHSCQLDILIDGIRKGVCLNVNC